MTRWRPLRRHGLVVDTLHFHAGSGWLADGLVVVRGGPGGGRRHGRVGIDDGWPVWPRSTSAAASAVSRGRRSTAVDLDAYMAVVARHLGPLGVVVGFEPGDLLVKDAGRPAGRGGHGRGSRRGSASSAWTPAGTSSAPGSSTASPRRSSCAAPPTRRARRWSRSPATSTRPVTSSSRTTRCRRSGRATSWRCSTPAATSRRCR